MHELPGPEQHRKCAAALEAPAAESLDARALQHVINDVYDARRRLDVWLHHAHVIVHHRVATSGWRLQAQEVTRQRVVAVLQARVEAGSEDRSAQHVVAQRLAVGQRVRVRVRVTTSIRGVSS